MTLKAFLFLFVVAIGGVVCSALIAEKIFDPGFERGITIAVLASLILFPAARWAEYRGWIKGDWSPGGEKRKAAEKAAEQARAAEAAEVAAAASAASAASAPATAVPGESSVVTPPASQPDHPADRPSSHSGESR